MSIDTHPRALVTGASSGLGREFVRQLVTERGFSVVATARRLDRLESLAGELPTGRVQVIAGDLASADFRQNLWQDTISQPGGIDLVINNAGLGNYDAFEHQSPDTIDQIVEINLVALLDLTQKAVQHMKPRGRGQIIEVSSVLGFVGLPGSAVYVASKHAVNGLVKTLRYELAGTGVRVWAACPGRTVSEFSQVARGGDDAKSHSWPPQEPTDRVVRAILKGLDRHQTFRFPSWRSRAVVQFAHWLPAAYDWTIRRSFQTPPGPASSRNEQS
jgi:short-subunit dehydrogenase